MDVRVLIWGQPSVISQDLSLFWFELNILVSRNTYARLLMCVSVCSPCLNTNWKVKSTFSAHQLLIFIVVVGSTHQLPIFIVMVGVFQSLLEDDPVWENKVESDRPSHHLMYPKFHRQIWRGQACLFFYRAYDSMSWIELCKSSDYDF